MKKRMRLLSMLLCGLLCAVMIPTTAQATGGSSGLTVNTSVVSFAGHDWWVIGDENSGVYSQPGSITLLAKNSEFGEGSFGASNAYESSRVRSEMNSIATGFSEAERTLINSRSDLYDDKLWALSLDEWTAIGDNTVRLYKDYYWLRTPSSTISNYAIAANGGYQSGISITDSVTDTRPALSMNVSDALFTFKAGGDNSKSSAAVDGGLIAATTADSSNPVKFTVKDEALSVSVTATASQAVQSGSSLSFGYTNASEGSDRYMACILTDSSGAVQYYGRLADCSSVSEGELSIPLAGVADGTYTLQIFLEKSNGEMYTDHCSEPVTMSLTVADGTGTVSDFGGTVLHEHSWASDWTYDESHHWHECRNAGCTITADSQKDGYGEHIYDRKVADEKYLAASVSAAEPARYYYSCECGAAGTETFAYGQSAGAGSGETGESGKTIPATGDERYAPLYLLAFFLITSGIVGTVAYTGKKEKL